MVNTQSYGRCPICNSSGLKIFYEVVDIPASCNHLWESKHEAINCPKGSIKLAFCPSCTFVSNITIEPEKNQYDYRFDNSLFYSKRFQNFAEELATNLIRRYDLHNKNIIEIGCGKVDFFSLLIKLGNNHGLRFNPFQANIDNASEVSVDSIISGFPQLNANTKPDFVFSYHELEHINHPQTFLTNLRKIFGRNSTTHFFFAVPNTLKTFKEGDFTEIIYEHVSYFTVSSLSYLFLSCGFNISEVADSKNEVFDSIYIDAIPKARTNSNSKPNLQPVSQELEDYIASFSTKTTIAIEKYRHRVKQLLDKGKRVVMWGAGSRGVTLLNILKDTRVEYAVDINPRKQGMYIPGTGQRIVKPEFLSIYRPDFLIIANTAYENEIRQIIETLGIKTDFVFV